MFEGQVESSQRINLLYDDATRYYHVITNLTGTMAKCYVRKAYNKGCKRHTSAIRPAVDVWQILRVCLQGFESPATITTDILIIRRVWIITRSYRKPTKSSV